MLLSTCAVAARRCGRPVCAWGRFASALLVGGVLTSPAWAGDPPVAHADGAGPLQARQCLIEPLRRIELRSAVAAPILAVHVERGATVRKGQLLVSLDASVEQAALQVAEFRSVMQGASLSAASRLKNASERLKRRDELLQQNFISAQDRDDAAAEARIAEADLTQARDERQMARLEAQQLKASVARFSIFSPINGVVTERLQNPGEMPQTGDNAPAILKLAQTDPLRVDIVLPVAQYGRVKAGGSVTVQPEAPFTGVYRATVKAVDKVIDSASGTFRVRLELPNPRGELPVGVRCTATL
jgi:RND family efflux transporter MFP subunit